MQLIVSTVVLIGLIALVAYISYPAEFKMGPNMPVVKYSYPYFCALAGLVSGLLVAAYTEYVTSHSYHPVR